MKRRKGLNIIGLLGLVIVFLCGCTDNHRFCNYDLKYGSFCSPTKQKLLVNKLRHQGMQVSYFGDYIYMIFPSRMLFIGKSADLRAEAYNTLKLMTEFLRCYQKITVHVIGFAGRPEDGCYAYLVHQQAQKVVDILWRRRIDARLMYSSSKKAKPTMDKAYWGNRIEIITKRLP